MAKFAGFLKRIKNFTNKVINTAAKGFKAVKGVWNNVITKPGVSILNTILPVTKPITDVLFNVDNQVNKGIDWVINKTNTKNNNNNNNNNNDNKQYIRSNPNVVSPSSIGVSPSSIGVSPSSIGLNNPPYHNPPYHMPPRHFNFNM